MLFYSIHFNRPTVWGTTSCNITVQNKAEIDFYVKSLQDSGAIIVGIFEGKECLHCGGTGNFLEKDKELEKKFAV